MLKLHKHISLLLLIAAFALFGSCEKKYAPGDWSIEPELPLPEEPEEWNVKPLRVVSLNMAVRNTVANYQALVDIVKEIDPDIIFLRQLDSATTRAQKVNRPADMAQQLGMEYYFMKNFDYQTGGFGNAVLSKYPIVDTKGYLLTKGAGEQRGMATARIKIDDHNEIVIAATELATALEERVIQVSDVIRYTANLDVPVILGGNFNDAPDSQTLTTIGGSYTFSCLGTSCPQTNTGDTPGWYDYITFKPTDRIRLVNHTVGSKAPSGFSFYPVIADLELRLLDE